MRHLHIFITVPRKRPSGVYIKIRVKITNTQAMIPRINALRQEKSACLIVNLSEDHTGNRNANTRESALKNLIASIPKLKRNIEERDKLLNQMPMLLKEPII